MTIGKWLAAIATAVCLSGCVTQVHTSVNRFPSTALPADLSGKTFVSMPLDSEKGSVEYETHAAAIAAYLERQGWRRTDDIKNADYAVAFSYGQGGPQSKTESFPIYGQTGSGTSYTSGNVNAYGAGGYGHGGYNATTYTPPTYGVVGTQTYTSTEFTRYLDTNIYDWKRSIAENKLVGVWESRATSTGSKGTFAEVSRCMIQAVFGDFRKSGSEKVQLVEDQCK